MMERIGCAPRGETSIQSVLIFPVLLTILFIGAHVTAYVHGSQVAHAAAIRGAQVAAAHDADAAGVGATLGEVDAVVEDLGFRTAAVPTVEITDRRVRVTVTVETQRVVPFLPVHVSRSAESPREVFLRQQDR